MFCGIQVIIIELLNEELVYSLLLQDYCVEDCNYLFDYYCFFGDKCLIYGGGVIYGVCDLVDIEVIIWLKMFKIFL